MDGMAGRDNIIFAQEILTFHVTHSIRCLILETIVWELSESVILNFGCTTEFSGKPLSSVIEGTTTRDIGLNVPRYFADVDI